MRTLGSPSRRAWLSAGRAEREAGCIFDRASAASLRTLASASPIIRAASAGTASSALTPVAPRAKAASWRIWASGWSRLSSQ